MTVFQKISAIWKEDNLLRRVVRNSSYLFGSNVFSSILSFVQTIIAVRLIGVAGWGLVSAIQTFASNTNRFLSFRMSEVVVKHLSPALSEQKKQEAAVLVKATGLTEAGTSVLAFLVLVLLTPWAARVFGKDIHTAPWFVFYGLILLSNLVFETSTGVLQATHRFATIARVNLIQSVITFSWILGTFLLNHWAGKAFAPYLIQSILLAYVLGKTYVGIMLLREAMREMSHSLEAGWWRIPLRTLPGKRSLIGFALNTNLNGTLNLVFRDNIPLYLAGLLSLTETGYFKIAMTFVIPLSLILDPLIAPTYAEISRTVAQFQWETTLRLLKRVTAITAGVVLAMCGFWALTGWWVIPTLYKPAALPAYPALLVLLLGYGFANIFQWNRPLLLTLGKSGFPVVVATLTGIVELVLIFWLVPRYGYLMMAVILSGYFVVSIGINTLRGLQEIRSRRLATDRVP